MKIYTRSGDKGTTALIGGKRVRKNHVRIEAYGTVDELIAYIGVVRDHSKDDDVVKDLVKVQDELMVCAAILASDCDDCQTKIPKLSSDSVVWLESAIDKMEEKLPQITSFILPGGHPAVSFCHVARTVCRRAERLTLSLVDKTFVPEVVIRYLNRLSDYLFVLARRLSVDFQAVEIPWQPVLDK